MKIQAKLHSILNPLTGNGKNGIWKKQDLILECEDKFCKKICVSIWGDKINVNSLKVGDYLDLECDIESKEYNGKWYTEIKVLRIEVIDFTMQKVINNEIPPLRISIQEDSDILPF